MNTSKGWNAFQLKIVMSCLMVLDHLALIPELLSPELRGIFHVVTRPVAVCFAYLAVEGFLHTRHRWRYNSRLFLWAGFMFLGNYTVNTLFQSKGIVLVNNIFLTLAVGLLVLNLCFGFSEQERQDRNQGRQVLCASLGVLVCLVGFILTEGGHILLPFMLITYLLRDKLAWRNLAYVILAVIGFYQSFVPYPSMLATLHMLMFNSDWLFILVLPFLSLYNGQRGPNTTFNKYAFYVFYPLHLWVLALIAFLCA